MFSWFKSKPAPEQRAKQIFATAEGPEVERLLIAGVVIALEAEDVIEQRKRFPPTEQPTFMIAYACCMLWAMKQGIAKVFQPQRVNNTMLAVKRHLVKHGAEAGKVE